MIYQLDKQSLDTQAVQFHARGVAHVELFRELLAGVSKDEVVQYVLGLLDELMTADPSLARYFHMALIESKCQNDPFGPMMKLLTRDSLYILDKASALLAKLLAFTLPMSIDTIDAHSTQVLDRHMANFTEWTLFILKDIDPKDVFESPKNQFAVQALQLLTATNRGRSACIAANCLPVFFSLISINASASSSSVQLLYQVLFSLWSISYSTEAALAIVNAKMGIIAKLVDIIKSVQKEKVARVALATLRNLLGTGSASSDMVAAGIMPVLFGLQPRKWADEDIVEDIEVLIAALQINLATMSSWDVYKKELASGKLEWSPSHKSEAFWKENYKNFEAKGFEFLKQLVALLSSEDPQILSIACNDIGEFIKHHPEGRRIMTQLGAKPHVMLALKHPDTTVQKYALTCVQRLMVINWEYLNK